MVVLPAKLRKRFGIGEGSYVIEEARRNLAALRPERLDDLRRLTEKLERVAAIIARVPIMSHNPRCVRIFRSPR
jgi:bifunctional DNA-binding transcriptional regulator/antitoxin component of YhaV-PrlF toxin-antitoxin module